MAGESRTSPRRIQAKLRQRQALELRLAERSYDEIAQALGYRHRSGAEMAVQAALRDVVAQPAEEVRSLYTGRLYAMLRAIWPRVVAGDLAAVATAVRVLERLAAYLGLDVPRRVTVDAEGTLRAIAAQEGVAWQVVAKHLVLVIAQLDSEAQKFELPAPQPEIIDAEVRG